LQLVPKLRHTILDHVLNRDILVMHREVRRTDGKDVRHKPRVPLRDTPDDSTAPVMAADDDAVDVELFGDAGDGVGVVFEAVVV